MLAPHSLQRLCPSSGHANIGQILPACRRPCWRLTPCNAFVLRPTTPTWVGFSRATGAHVGASLPAAPLSFVRPRQHGSDFPGRPAPLLAPRSLQRLCPSSGHANIGQILPACRRPCWRLTPCNAFVLRPTTPTWVGFSRAAGALVGASLPAAPLSFVRSRQHGPLFPGLVGAAGPEGLEPKKTAPGRQSPLDDEKEHVRLDQPG